MQCTLFAVICLAISASTLDFSPRDSIIDNNNNNSTFEQFNQTEFLPNADFASDIPLNITALNRTRQERIHVFRPLFVYRQEQLMKKRVKPTNPDRNTSNKHPNPTTPRPAQNPNPAYIPYAPSVPLYPYITYQPSPPYANSQSQSYYYPTYQYPIYSAPAYPSSSYASYYSPPTPSTYYTNSYYAGWPSTGSVGSNYDYYYDTSKAVAGNGATSSAWQTSPGASVYAPQAASISYNYPTAWRRT